MPDLWIDGVTTLPFWARGSIYTIVPGRHIGLDRAPLQGASLDVPALVPGRVERSVQTLAMGRVVVTDTGRSQRRYISYCHGFNGDAAQSGATLPVSGRVMRLARGWESPGTLWNGLHCHVVVHDKPGGAYLTGQGDTYYDPAQELRDYAARGASSGTTAKPFPPPSSASSRPLEDQMIAIKSPNRPPRALDSGGSRILSAEEWDNFWGVKYEGNDRQYDLAVSVRSGLTPWAPVDSAFLGRSPNRPWTLFAPGYIKVLSGEELSTSPFTSRRVEGNDRQYDLWVSQAVTGTAPSSERNEK